MKRNTTRILCMTLAILLLACMAVGCGTTATKGPEGSGAATANPASIEEYPLGRMELPLNVDFANMAGKKITIFNSAGAPKESEDLRSYRMYEQFKAETGVEIEYVTQPASGVMEKLFLLVAAKQGPTVLTSDNTVMPLYAARGLLTPIDKYVNPEDPAFLPYVMDAYTWKGNRYCMQYNTWLTWRSVIYNDTAFQAAGLSDPWETYQAEGNYSWEQLFEDSSKLFEFNEAGNPTSYGYCFSPVDVEFALALNDASFYLVDGSDNYTLNQNDPKVTEILTMFENAVIHGDAYYGYGIGEGDLISGKAKMFGQVWERSERICNREDARERGLRLKSVPMPVGPSNTTGKKFAAVPWFNLLGANSPNPDIGYYYVWWNSGVRVPTYYDSDNIIPTTREEFISKKLEWVQYLYFFLDEQIYHPDRFVVPCNILGIPGFGGSQGLFEDLCNEVYGQRQSLSAKLIEYTPQMQEKLAAIKFEGDNAVGEIAVPNLPEPITFDSDLGIVSPWKELPSGWAVEWTEDGIDGGSLKLTVDGDPSGNNLAQALFTISGEGITFPALNYYRVIFDYKFIEGEFMDYDEHGFAISIIKPDDSTLTNYESGYLDEDATLRSSKIMYMSSKDEDQNRFQFSTAFGELAVDKFVLLIDNITFELVEQDQESAE